MGTYTKSSINRTARPRSERLRELGGLIVPVSAAAAAGYALGGSGHTHPNLIDLNKIVTNDGYVCLSTEVADPDTGDISREIVKAKAGYADRTLANADGYTLDWFFPVTVNGSPMLKVNPSYAGLFANGGVPCGRSDHRWGKVWSVDADLSGNLTMDSTGHIDIGPVRLQYNSSTGCLQVTTNQTGANAPVIGIHADGQVAAGGIGNNPGIVKYVACTQQEYNDLPTKDEATIYAIGDPVSKVYLGGNLLFSES